MRTYTIDGCNEMFLTLTAIRVDEEGKVSYGKTIKY
ncbi:hypothetical protein C341T2LP_00057 [Bacteroides phage C3_41T2LP]|nr:hypothetical protein C341T2LP_00057 [Bacteroides phage C3_41T2LP]